MDFEQKRKLKKYLYSKPALVVLMLMLLFVGKATWNVYDKLETSEGNLEMAERDIEKLKLRKNALASQIQYLQTEQGVEAEIRQKFRLVKEGEQIAVIIDDNIELPTATTTENKSFWSSFKGWFGSGD